eukprot:Colp12_sorted_trinity150504_noHs@12120
MTDSMRRAATGSSLSTLNSRRSSLDEDKTHNFFVNIRQKTPEGRQKGLNKIIASVQSWADACHSDPEAKVLLKTHLPGILRLSLRCPFEEVRIGLTELLRSLEEKGLSTPKPKHALGPSFFIPRNLTVDPTTHSEELSPLFIDAFLHDARVSHMVQVMAFHPEFLDAFLKTHHFLLRMDGPLPVIWRAYLAAMAASQHNCKYLVDVWEGEFRSNGGPVEWLKGISYAPKKLQNIVTLNALLAHQPWLVTQEHIRALV